MTPNGRPAVAGGAKRLGRMPPHDRRMGTLLWYSYPSSFQHWTADYAITIRLLPLSPTQTEVVTTWLVSGDAQEGVDYDAQNLCHVWRETNRQDKELVEGVQQGVYSPAFVPGPYNALHETGVIEFVDWYAAVMSRRCQAQ